MCVCVCMQETLQELRERNVPIMLYIREIHAKNKSTHSNREKLRRQLYHMNRAVNGLTL